MVGYDAICPLQLPEWEEDDDPEVREISATHVMCQYFRWCKTLSTASKDRISLII